MNGVFMILFIRFSILFIFFTSLFFNGAYAQLPWTKDSENPLLRGEHGAWDQQVLWPNVLYNSDSTRYEMWYSGSSSNRPENLRIPKRIGFAISPDGINWTKHPNPVLVPDPGTWDESSVDFPMVILENGQYKMWYTGWSPSDSVVALGYATSPDGKNWTKHGSNPVLTTSGANWDAGGIGDCYIMPISGGYKIWYCGWTADYSYSDIGYATSNDGINWIPYNNNPVVKHGVSGSWDDGVVKSPSVLIVNDTYHLWYAGKRLGESYSHQIAWATSADGINWNKYDDTQTMDSLYAVCDPVLKPGSDWDEDGVNTGTVFLEEDSLLHMWYSGVEHLGPPNLWRIGVATAPVILNVPGDYSTIQGAINNASDGNLILVADGTYQENINFKGKAITVASYFYLDNDINHISNTIIDGSNPSNPDIGSVVYFLNGEDTTSILSGFTLTQGVGGANGSGGCGCCRENYTGGGITCYESNPLLTNLFITENRSIRGGGMYLFQSNPKLSKITISRNIAGEEGGGIHFGRSTCGTINSKPKFDEYNRCNIYSNYAPLGGDLFSAYNAFVTVFVDTFTLINPDSSHVYPIQYFILDIKNEMVTEIENFYFNPTQYSLSQNYPNPFNPSTTIEFVLSKSDFVKLKVYNILGKEVTTILSKKLNQGIHSYTFDGNNLASGVYYYRLEAGNFMQTRKMVYLK